MKWSLLLIGCFIAAISVAQPNKTKHSRRTHTLSFPELPKRWDEGLPLGNGWLGALIWQKENKIRLSLDRADLWDDRPMPLIDRLNFKWVEQQVLKGQYDTVQKLGDRPYDRNPAPTRLPGAALEFDLASFGQVKSVQLSIYFAVGVVEFTNGILFKNYVHATHEVGHFNIANVPATFTVCLIHTLVMPDFH